VFEQLESTQSLAKAIGPYYSGIATYLLTGAAMVVGSLIKRDKAGPKEVNNG